MKNKINPSDPSTIEKFVDSLPIPAIARVDNTCDYPKPRKPLYSIFMNEVNHKFHRNFPYTKVWGYNGTCPGPTIEVSKNSTINVEWINDLPDKHLLPVDHTLHGAMDTPDTRTVVHLHGANVDSESDGHPEAWFTKNYSSTGAKFKREVYEYTNNQPGATLWYHDHAIGITRLNVYSGLAGFYLIRDELEEKLKLPCGKYEIPLMIQDKSFNEDGSLFYPDNSTPPVDKPIPSATAFFFGDTIAVNGKLWPYLNVEPRKYRFRILNASNVRAYDISLDNDGVFTQIGTDLGLLKKSIEIDSFILEPAERMDLVIDFSKYEGEEITLLNSGGPPGEHTGIIMKFNVNLPLRGKDESEVPEDLFPYHSVNTSLAIRERTMNLDESTDDFGRTIHLLNDRMWHHPVTEVAELDTIEIWHLVNHFDFAHPVHVHLVNFEILGRKEFTEDDFDEDGNYKFDADNLIAPLSYERGLKDTVRAEPGQVTSIAMHFKGHTGDYVWHCHILEHEDNDMMRPLKVIE
ncbi:multicopper oxidase family protein [Senegalia sp. (in: firmicutes)]|uniref:multicopper oxidase family protein n=1 Tax=Senegalia sp. (in: firmicutes) TaxID=1924098 RepID=UPI003F9C8EE3